MKHQNQTDDQTKTTNGKPVGGIKLRPYQFILNGELRVYDKLKSKFETKIQQYYETSKLDMVPAVEGVILVLRPKDGPNGRSNFYDGKVIDVLKYSDMQDVIDEIESIQFQFEAWRLENLRLRGIKVREFMDNMKQGDYRKLNNAMTFMTLITILAKPSVVPAAERMTIFYSGYSASNIRRGEWFNTKTLKIYEQLGSDILSKFGVTQIGDYSVVNSITDVECDTYEFKFNMNIAKEVYIQPESKNSKMKLTDVPHFGGKVTTPLTKQLIENSTNGRDEIKSPGSDSTSESYSPF